MEYITWQDFKYDNYRLINIKYCKPLKQINFINLPIEVNTIIDLYLKKEIQLKLQLDTNSKKWKFICF